MKLRKRYMTLLLALVLCIASAAAADTFAADMRLELTEGLVALSNDAGRNMSVRPGMKLYNGYTVLTEMGSYAYVKLDDSKLVKMDAKTQVAIHKSGDLLELRLEKGELFFDIASPLTGDETLNISTSTMVTGIRGTSGYVIDHAADEFDAQGNRKLSTLVVLDGTVEVQYQTAEGPITQSVTAGEALTIVENAEGGDVAPVIVEVSVEEIPRFVAVQIARDEELQQRIIADNGLTAEEIEALKEEAGDDANPDSASGAMPIQMITERVTQGMSVKPVPKPTPIPATPAPTPVITPSP